jgi:hypothetical protein
MKITLGQLRRIVREQIEDQLNDQLPPPPEEILLNKDGWLASEDEEESDEEESDEDEFGEEPDYDEDDRFSSDDWNKSCLLYTSDAADD